MPTPMMLPMIRAIAAVSPKPHGDAFRLGLESCADSRRRLWSRSRYDDQADAISQVAAVQLPPARGPRCRRLEGHDRPRLAATSSFAVGHRADHGQPAGLLDERAGRADLRAHRALREARLEQRGRCRTPDRALLRRAPVGVGRVDVGEDEEDVGVEVDGEQRAREVLVDDRLDADEPAPGRHLLVGVPRRDAAAAGADHDASLLEQRLDRDGSRRSASGAARGRRAACSRRRA